MLHLHKPLAFFDLETTGTNVTQDRIIEIAVVKVMPNQEIITKSDRVNPGIPIPIESSMIHGIYDKDVTNCPLFKDLAHSYAQFIQGCDLAGFNHIKFDIPLLMEEFYRYKVEFDLTNRKLVDAQKIFHMMEPRTLTAAYRFYCNKELEGAHSALHDTMATFEVLKAQVQKYDGKEIKDSKGKVSIPVKNDVAALHALSFEMCVDLANRMIFNDKKEEIFNFGKYKGQKVEDIFKKDPSYYDWMMNGDFPADTKKKITEIKLRALKK